jgi:DNA-binding transcriptional LysR family regulator
LDYRPVNLRQLEYLIAIAEDGSFRAAAHRLHVAAPSISQQIRLLEHEVGGPLLERLPRGARLTSAGRAFLPEARSALLAAQRAQRAGRAALTLELAEIEIATVLSLAVGLLPPAIQRMVDAHPGMSVRLHEFAHRELLEDAFDGGLADVAVGPMPQPGRHGPAVFLGHESFVVIVGRRHRAFASRDPVPLQSLAADGWILFPVTHGLHGVVMAICGSAGFVPRDAVRTAQVEAAARLAAAGVGVAIVPANIVPSDLDEHVRATDPPIFRRLGAYTRVELSPQANALISALRATPWAEPPPGAFILH